VFTVRYEHQLHINSKVNLVRVRGGLWGCEMLRIPYRPHHRLTDSCETVSFTRSNPQKQFCLFLVLSSVKMSKQQDQTSAGRIRLIEIHSLTSSGFERATGRSRLYYR
jgi:hypothetical protein